MSLKPVSPRRLAAGRATWLASLLVLAIGCTAHRPLRTMVDGPMRRVATSIDQLEDPSPQGHVHRRAVASAALEEHQGFNLAVIEIDDQGELWSRQAAEQVLSELRSVYDHSPGGVNVFVFLHGWKHNASVCDENLACYRELLAYLAEREERTQRGRPVWGIYLSWRGKSLSAPLLKEFSFWSRKATAERVGRNGVTEVLAKLDSLHRNSLEGKSASTSRSRLTIIGHSFGASMAFSAYGGVLKERLTAFLSGGSNKATQFRGCGSLLVLANPAFEASVYQGLHHLAGEATQWPVDQPLVVLTAGSEGDSATRVAFPIGRAFASLFQRTRDSEQKRRLRTTVPNYGSFVTHRLVPTEMETIRTNRRKNEACSCPERLRSVLAPRTFGQAPPPPARLVLIDPNRPQAHSPFNVAIVDKRVIADHGDVFSPVFIPFLLDQIDRVDTMILPLAPRNLRLLP